MKKLIDNVNVSDKVSSGNTVEGTLYQCDNVVNERGKVVLRRRPVAKNTLIIGGTQMVARQLVENPGTAITIRTLDAELADVMTPVTSVRNSKQYICAIGVFNGGATNNLVTVVDRSGCGFTKANLIPFRMFDESKDNIATMLEDYACRTVEDGYSKYYLKKLKDVTVVNRTVDKVDLPDRPDINTPNHTSVETVIQFSFSIDLDDLAEYYASIGETLERKFSSIAVFVGNKVDCNVNKHTGIDHRELMATNVLNIKEESLNDNRKLEYQYEIVFR